MYEIGTTLVNLTDEQLKEISNYLSLRGDSFLMPLGENRYGVTPNKVIDDANRRAEIWSLKEELKATDYCVIKCMELGESMATLYPEVHAKRTAARQRINELEALIAAESTSEES